MLTILTAKDTGTLVTGKLFYLDQARKAGRRIISNRHFFGLDYTKLTKEFILGSFIDTTDAFILLDRARELYGSAIPGNSMSRVLFYLVAGSRPRSVDILIGDTDIKKIQLRFRRQAIAIDRASCNKDWSLLTLVSKNLRTNEHYKGTIRTGEMSKG